MMTESLQQLDNRIGDLFAKHGITQLWVRPYGADSYRHVRKQFTGYATAKRSDQESTTTFLYITTRLCTWLEKQDLSLYDTADVMRTMAYTINRDGRVAITVDVDLYGRLDD